MHHIDFSAFRGLLSGHGTTSVKKTVREAREKQEPIRFKETSKSENLMSKEIRMHQQTNMLRLINLQKGCPNNFTLKHTSHQEKPTAACCCLNQHQQNQAAAWCKITQQSSQIAQSPEQNSQLVQTASAWSTETVRTSTTLRSQSVATFNQQKNVSAIKLPDGLSHAVCWAKTPSKSQAFKTQTRILDLA